MTKEEILEKQKSILNKIAELDTEIFDMETKHFKGTEKHGGNIVLGWNGIRKRYVDLSQVYVKCQSSVQFRSTICNEEILLTGFPRAHALFFREKMCR